MIGTILAASFQLIPVYASPVAPAAMPKAMLFRTSEMNEPVVSHQQVMMMATQMTSSDIDDWAGCVEIALNSVGSSLVPGRRTSSTL